MKPSAFVVFAVLLAALVQYPPTCAMHVAAVAASPTCLAVVTPGVDAELAGTMPLGAVRTSRATFTGARGLT